MVEHSARMRNKANQYFFSKVLFNICLMIAGALLIASFLRQLQRSVAVYKQQENSREALEEALDTLKSNETNAEELTQIFHMGNQDKLEDLNRLLTSGLFDFMTDSDDETRSEVLADIVSRSGVDYLFIMGSDGKVLLAPNPGFAGVNPVQYGLMSQVNQNHLLRGTVESDGRVNPAFQESQYADYYFYSMPLAYGNRGLVLVLGADSEILNLQISSLKDLSVVLANAAMSNDGFLFAVNKEDASFLYYQNGEEVLTGKNALDTGLTEDALEDGYVGLQVINGVRYHCVSRTYGESTVICAVAETDSIYANDRHVLFWSILGYILVMLLCLIYAVIVRNDFVRRAVKTDRKVFFPQKGNPIFFDKSIFRKIFPLMISGVLLIFCISFYTQTLLEISQCIDEAVVALEEVTKRYQDSSRNRELITEYYNDLSLSKARLLAYLIEENPGVLNEETERYYSYYDENQEKQYLTDDEGNRLRSVSKSKELQELCDVNNLKSIYIFDKSGHTIATNTQNWYFTINQEEGTQSNAFLGVVDGKSDALVQEAMMDETASDSQYVGVAFHYYTTKDENGDTVYVSRYDYESAENRRQEYERTEAGAEDAGPVITAHRSMLQIGLDRNVSDTLLASTDTGRILSSNMLSNGFIVLLDTSSEHKCLYSPFESSIGKTAEELGVSPNAFKGGDYYGFMRINGIEYFQYFRYEQGYYIATATPRSSMYPSRFPIALLTAITSLILILILSGTVTFTSKEEEYLYATMSEEEAAKGLDSAIFNIILPSGRQTSTVKASARWDNSRIPWSEKSPEQKLLFLISILFGIIVLYILITILGVERFFDEGSIVRYIVKGGWDRGLNIFAFSACVIVLVFTGLGVTLFRIPVRITSVLLGARGETISHLLLSVLKYGGTIGAFFYCLYLVGMDSTNLLASAGVLSLVIGLGAQSLIKDIIAGIFIVFEGEFRVGDIVTIDSYRGTVMDIGLRTTKIMSPDGNIKIFNNSDISGVLNMTKEASIAVCTIGIEYGQDIDYVEEVLKRELPALRGKNPLILEDPVYLGVQTLGPSSVDLLIMCKCFEKDIRIVTRYLNREVLQIFYRNSINVPFPQVTISNLDMQGRKTIKDIEEADQKENGGVAEK